MRTRRLIRQRIRTVLALVTELALLGSVVTAFAEGDGRTDGAIDLDDYAQFAACFTGPGQGLGSGCDVFDSDSDTDVDHYDFAAFQRVFGTFVGVVIDTVTIGNPGNAGELSGAGAGGNGPDRVCGAVDYVYNIGKYEVTAGQYTEFLNAVAATDTYGLYNPNMDSDPAGCQITRNGASGSYTYDFSGRPSGTEADWVDRPVNFVSWGDAARLANWLHNGQPTGAEDLTTTEDGSYYLNGATSNAALQAVTREDDATWVIPSEDEWYKAAYHKNDGVSGNYWNYPTSSDSVPGYVNDNGDLSGTGTAFTEGGTDPGNYATYDGDGGAYGIGGPYFRTDVGEWENSQSPYGTFDQGGNVWEWDEAMPYGSFRGLRGGSFYNIHGRTLRAATRSYHSPTYEIINLGFRVAEIPNRVSRRPLSFIGRTRRPPGSYSAR